MIKEVFTKIENEELAKRIEDGDKLTEKVTSEYNKLVNDYNKATSPRTALKLTLRSLFEWIEEDKGVRYPKEQIDEAIEVMHDDENFINDLLDFFEEHLQTMGENYGL
ncbi:MAG: hypothetical protein ACOZCL_08570 [Bacillota bacterium]